MHEFLMSITAVVHEIAPANVGCGVHPNLWHGTVIVHSLLVLSSGHDIAKCVVLDCTAVWRRSIIHTVHMDFIRYLAACCKQGVLILLIVAALDVICGKVHQIVGPWQRLRFLLANEIHILLRATYLLQIAQPAVCLVEPVHCVHPLVLFPANWILRVHFLWRHKFHEPLCAHSSIHLVQLADGSSWHGHGRLKTDVTAKLLGTERAVVCVRHSVIVSCFLRCALG